ncbi:MAG: WecB/TagA/CpsF family glycosyltransferase [Prevotella sp.]|nr:WecB/TagA/CpsF family glycosyltransferase [Prevotella sp.]MCI6447031.1 WecB/TagA/CpsF family glycosyltransferase [Prevotella sp.]MDD7508666.1 WecB/TagA/CpsF family glycosyltransferase [Prevotella sp.]MEE1152786.1 WecB/TagA/CpsF family glycosyltransferase [Prevotella sp.]
MRMKLKDLDILTSRAELAKLPEGKLLINTINAFSYDNARKDVLFSEALQKGDVLIPDGISIVKACRFLNAKSQPKERIAGWDLFVYEMEKLNRVGGKVMFLGSSDAVLNLIRQRVAEKYPKIEVDTYSPPYKPVFSDEENEAMISAINHSNPDLLWIGMTAPKQEKWAYTHLDRLDVHCHIGTIGAVFDFFAGTVKRAPERWQRAGLEWLYRLLSEPRRMWRRYFIGNAKFIYYIMVEKIM